MSRYIPKVCPNCGANLDPDERCDCDTNPYRGVPRQKCDDIPLSMEEIRAILDRFKKNPFS